jgi:hypothetical protein
MTADRIGYAHPKTHPADTCSEVAKEDLVIKQVMGRGPLSRNPTQVSIPKRRGEDILEVVNGQDRVEAHQPGKQYEQIGGTERGLRPDLESDGDLSSDHVILSFL